MINVLLSIKIGLDPTIVKFAGLDITWHGLFTAAGGIVGARGLYVIEHWSMFKNDLGQMFAINTGGISIYGGLIGGAIGAWGYAMITKVPNIPRGADIAGMGAIMGM